MTDDLHELHRALESARRLLPSQGPIAEFIHHNPLHRLHDLGFDAALLEGAKVLGAQCYMPLAYYRQCVEDFRIDENVLDEEMSSLVSRLTLTTPDTCVFKAPATKLAKALAVRLWTTADVQTLKFAFLELMRRKGHSRKESESLLERVSSLVSLQESGAAELSQMRPRLRPGQPLLFRILAAYFDQGLSYWRMPHVEESLWEALRAFAKDSIGYLPFDALTRRRDVLEMSAEMAAMKLLEERGVAVSDWAEFVRTELAMCRGWAGLVDFLERQPDQLIFRRKPSLVDLLALKLLLDAEEFAFVPVRAEHVVSQGSVNPQRLLSLEVCMLLASVEMQEALPQVSDADLAWLLEFRTKCSDFLLQSSCHRALERSEYYAVVRKLEEAKTGLAQDQIPSISQPAKGQYVFCIDDRECSVRRHIEQIEPRSETFGFAGFFGMDFVFQSLDDHRPGARCPPQVRPSHLVVEVPAKGESRALGVFHAQRKREVATHWLLYSSSQNWIFGWFATKCLGVLSFFKLLRALVTPIAFAEKNALSRPKVRTDLTLYRERHGVSASGELSLGYSFEELADRVASVLKGIGLLKGFSPVVAVLGHGSTSNNNPHFSAYECGACSGKSGAPNARAFAMATNHATVRALLLERGVSIPDSTWFVGGFHDTCSDEVHFFDQQKIPPERRQDFVGMKDVLRQAMQFNALERCRKFDLVSPGVSAAVAMTEVKRRSAAIFEPRPELGHATNAFCMVGRRSMTRGVFLDRRSFLVSYDYRLDDDGRVLEGILAAIVPVCVGINLEYLFARIDSEKYGSGTKLAHNICSMVGVTNGIDEDLRPGLPAQMVELHDPVRLLFVLERSLSEVSAILERRPLLESWFSGGWAHLACQDPLTGHVSGYQRNQLNVGCR